MDKTRPSAQEDYGQGRFTIRGYRVPELGEDEVPCGVACARGNPLVNVNATMGRRAQVAALIEGYVEELPRVRTHKISGRRATGAVCGGHRSMD